MRKQVLSMTFEEMPTSVNKIYQRDAFGGQHLRKEAQAWINLQKNKARHLLVEISRLDPDKMYAVEYDFHMQDVRNAGWPKSAKTRYKKKDVSNLVKLAEDTFKDIIGIDDSNFFDIHIKKMETRGVPFVRVRLFELSDDLHLLP